MKAYLPFAACMGLMCALGAWLPSAQDCEPHFDIGMTYHAIQQGPCPDIDSLPSFRTEDSLHVGYACRSKHIMVVGDVRTGKTDALFLYNGQ